MQLLLEGYGLQTISVGFKMSYTHQRQGDTVKVEIKDFTRRLIYRSKFNIRDKNAILALLKILETYSGFSIAEIVKDKLKKDWF